MSIDSDLNDSLNGDVRVGRKRLSKKESLNERSEKKDIQASLIRLARVRKNQVNRS